MHFLSTLKLSKPDVSVLFFSIFLSFFSPFLHSFFFFLPFLFLLSSFLLLHGAFFPFFLTLSLKWLEVESVSKFFFFAFLLRPDFTLKCHELVKHFNFQLVNLQRPNVQCQKKQYYSKSERLSNVKMWMPHSAKDPVVK